jgi:integrase
MTNIVRTSEPCSEEAARAATVAELMARLDADPELAPAQQRDLLSALRTFARCVGRDPAAIPTDVATLRQLIGQAQPASARLSPKRWQNVRSGLRQAITRYRNGHPRQWQAGLLTGRWREIRDQIADDTVRIGLSRLFRFLGGSSIAPEAVNADTFAAFRLWLTAETLCPDPETVYRRSLKLWNRAAEQGAPWPKIDVQLAERTRQFVLPLSRFPASLAAELQAWSSTMSGTDVMDERAPGRPFRPRTVAHEVMVLRRFASALVHQGLDPQAIGGLADLVQPDRFKLALRYFLDAREGKPTAGMGPMAGIVVAVARHWVRVDHPTLEQLRRLAKRVSAAPSGLTEKNRRRLTQFDDPQNVIRLLNLPDQLVRSAEALGDERRAALMVQAALAIAILLAAPLRLRNLAHLDLERHVIRTGRPGSRQSVRLAIERDETKNRQVLDYPLPDATVRILDLYLARYHRMLGSGGSWLFPGRDRRPKDANLLSEQIQAAIRRHTGLVMHVHLFRHFAGKLSLMMDPANYEQVRRLLGHQTIDTTTAYYTGFATDAAARRYHEQVLLRPRPARPPKQLKAPQPLRRLVRP